jgi:hypothetical protein
MTLYHPSRDLDNFIILHILQSFFTMSSLLLEAFCLRWDSQLWEPAAFFEAFCQAILRGIRACAATKVNSSTRHFARRSCAASEPAP